MKSTKHRPTTWQKLKGIIILDPDGWRTDKKSFYAPLTESEWHHRQMRSTCMFKKDLFERS